MKDLLEMSGSDFKSDTGLNYCSAQSVTEFQSPIASIVLDSKLSELSKSGLYSITANESTDKGNRKRILMYLQYISGDSIDTFLLSNTEISEGTADAETLVSMILNELKCKGLDLTNLVGLGTDGACIMTGGKWCSEETKRHLSLSSWGALWCTPLCFLCFPGCQRCT